MTSRRSSRGIPPGPRGGSLWALRLTGEHRVGLGVRGQVVAIVDEPPEVLGAPHLVPQGLVLGDRVQLAGGPGRQEGSAVAVVQRVLKGPHGHAVAVLEEDLGHAVRLEAEHPGLGRQLLGLLDDTVDLGRRAGGARVLIVGAPARGHSIRDEG